MRLIARQLAKIHAIHATQRLDPQVQPVAEDAGVLLPRPHRVLGAARPGQDLEEEMVWMEETLSGLGSPVVLCHNDLPVQEHHLQWQERKSANVRATVADRTWMNVRFIDYEYSGYNYQAYDIGNHFNEFAGTERFFPVNEVDYSLYPERALQLQWLQAYLSAFKEYKGVKAEVSESEVERLYVQVNQFALASHFFWGLWALIQAKYSKIDF
ncbi:unnamed protein product [Ranitomeya imitator]|uniref:ethanolamine kinase n=1 Tax=Ranitomeya imitator TaxID=111125 RepID=A0ABN9MDH9_9NEOB|nr:unnamed protein product [Ranitomeya imitator]